MRAACRQADVVEELLSEWRSVGAKFWLYVAANVLVGVVPIGAFDTACSFTSRRNCSDSTTRCQVRSAKGAE